MYSFEHCTENFDEIGEGSSRIVFGLDNEWVLKLPITNGGIWQNSNEVEFYKKYRNSNLPLCPIDLELSSSDHIVMRRAEPMSELEDDTLYMQFDSIVLSYIEECSEKYKDYKDKLGFIKDLINKRTDIRIIDFIKKLSTIKNSTVQYLFYDVCSFNCGLLNDEIVVLDYGYPDDGTDHGNEFYKNTETYTSWFNKD